MSIETQLANDLTALVQRWNLREDEMVDWLTGTATGGPNGDGRYPLTTADGVVYLVACPALLQNTVDGPAGQAQGSANSAALAQAASEAARDAAQSAQSAAELAASQTQTLKDETANAEANVRTLVKWHFPSGSSLRVPQKSASLPVDDLQGIMRWDDNYMYLKTTNGWKRIPLESF